MAATLHLHRIIKVLERIFTLKCSSFVKEMGKTTCLVISGKHLVYEVQETPYIQQNAY
jgi:hypothetical protein